LDAVEAQAALVQGLECSIKQWTMFNKAMDETFHFHFNAGDFGDKCEIIFS
jgi:hypothetical protein